MTTQVERERKRVWYLANQDLTRATARKRYAADPKRYNEKSRQYYVAHKKSIWEQRLRKKYGITACDWFRILERQGYVCAVCGQSLSRLGSRDLHTDHDHESGRVRGILCAGCNLAIGHLPSVAVARGAAEYLERTQ